MSEKLTLEWYNLDRERINSHDMKVSMKKENLLSRQVSRITSQTKSLEVKSRVNI